MSAAIVAEGSIRIRYPLEARLRLYHYSRKRSQLGPLICLDQQELGRSDPSRLDRG